MNYNEKFGLTWVRVVAGHSKFSLQLTFKCKTILHDSTLQLIQNKGPHLDKNAVFYHYISMW